MTPVPDFTLSEKVKVVLDYLVAGNTIDFEGRSMRLHPDALMLVTDAKTLKFLGGPPVERSGQIGVNMSLSRFLKLCDGLTVGALTRMQQVVRFQQTSYAERSE